jgi:(p)ppGpp synthase/HD superfamily hydrolase
VELTSVEDEAALKVQSMLSGATPTWPVLLDALKARVGEEGRSEAERAMDVLHSLSSVSSDHPSMSAYLDHPVRVAWLLLRVQRDVTAHSVVTALLHNVYEVGGLDERGLASRGVPEHVARHVRLLTIDRSLEADRRYLEGFYGAIEAAGPELSLIRTLDKLDNLLGLQLLEDGPVRESYLDLAVAFVEPMAYRLSPELGAFFAALAEYMRVTPCSPELRARYDALVEGVS